MNDKLQNKSSTISLIRRKKINIGLNWAGLSWAKLIFFAYRVKNGLGCASSGQAHMHPQSPIALTVNTHHFLNQTQ
jgi:hypothetical protein